MREVKFRLRHAERMLKRLPERDSFENRVLVSEAVALQFRKAIELIALASIAANETEYARVREEFHRDWNARLIFRDLERLNARFYPTPIAGLSDPIYEGGSSVIEEHDFGFLARDDAISLYERCAGIVHAENPFGGKTNYDEVLSSFKTMIPLFKVLLGNFWVYLVPADKAFCVWMYFDQEKDVDIALFKIG
ncbi:MAG: hypothetical protein WA435_01465 [Gallionellaceae bacterium]